MIIFYRILSESPNIEKVSLMLKETGLDHEVKIVNTHDGVDAELEAISPNGTFPAIVDTDTGATVFESGAILHYLAEKSGMLLPSNIKDRAESMKWLMFEVSNVSPIMLELYHYLLNDAGDLPAFVFDRYKNMLRQFCNILEKQLDQRDYLAGDFSIADIALYPWMVTLEDMAEINVEDYPNINRWTASIKGRY